MSVAFNDGGENDVPCRVLIEDVRVRVRVRACTRASMGYGASVCHQMLATGPVCGRGEDQQL